MKWMIVAILFLVGVVPTSSRLIRTMNAPSTPTSPIIGPVFDTTTPRFDYHNTAVFDVSGDSIFENGLSVGGGDFRGGKLKQTCRASVVPTVDHGRLTTDSSNCIGEIKDVGHTRVTLTLDGAATVTKCLATVEGPRPGIITAQDTGRTIEFFCFDTTGFPSACPDFYYHCWEH